MTQLIASTQAIDMRQAADWDLPAISAANDFINGFVPVLGGGVSSTVSNSGQILNLSMTLQDSTTISTPGVLFITATDFVTRTGFTSLLVSFGHEPGPYDSFLYTGNFNVDIQQDSFGAISLDTINHIYGTATAVSFNTDGTYNQAGASLISVSGIDQQFSTEGSNSPTEDPPDSATFSGSDAILGSSQNDYLLGYTGNDKITGGKGNDTIDGGDGTDTALYSGIQTNYTVTRTSLGYTVKDNVGTGSTDTLINIERLQYSDGTLALDVGNWQTAGETYRLYRAAFARTPDNGGLKYWIAEIDNGQTNEQVAHNFIVSAEFQSLYGSNSTHDQLITALYQNVLDRAPDRGGFDYWKGLLENNQITDAQLLINFSESNENVAIVGQTIGHGIWLAS